MEPGCTRISPSVHHSDDDATAVILGIFRQKCLGLRLGVRYAAVGEWKRRDVHCEDVLLFGRSGFEPAMRPLLFIGFLLQLVTATPWSRGNYGKLSFTADCSSYSFDFGRETLHANATSPENCTQTFVSATARLVHGMQGMRGVQQVLLCVLVHSQLCA